MLAAILAAGPAWAGDEGVCAAAPGGAPAGGDDSLRGDVVAGAPVVPGDGSGGAAVGALDAPVSAEARLAIARRLAEDPRTHEEALDALLALVGEPATTQRAHLALVRLLRRADPRPGWLDAYARLAGDPRTTSAEAAALRLRADEARTWVPDEAARARDALLAEAARVQGGGSGGAASGGADAVSVGSVPLDDDLAFHLARAHLVLGELDAAAPLLATRPEDARFADGARALALARPDADGPLGDRIRAVAALGYADLALRLAPRDDPDRRDPGAWVAHAALLAARGRDEEAHAALGGALGRAPGEPVLVEARVRLFLAAGDLVGARAAAAGAPDAERRVRAAALAAEAPEEAYALAPDEPTVRLALAEARLAEGRAREAEVLLAPLVEGAPDRAVLARYAAAANAAGRAGVGLAAWRTAVTRAAGPRERGALAAGLADALAEAAEARKAAGGRGEPAGRADAVALYRVAVTARPGSAATWAGLGGALWDAGARAAALDAYTFAVGSAPTDPSAPGWAASAADLALAVGRPAAAIDVVAPFVGRHPALAARGVLAEAALVGAPTPVEALEAMLAEHPADPALVALVAGRLEEAGRGEAALAAWEILVEQRPEDAYARVDLARALARVGRFDAALAALDTTVSGAGRAGVPGGPAGAAPGGSPDVAPGGAPGGALPGASGAAAGPGADPALVAAVGRARADVLRARGDARWLREGRDADALDDYAASLAAAPDAWTWAAIGGLYLAHGQPALAVPAFRAGRALDPGNPLAGAGEVRALAALGDVAGARAALAGLPDPDGTLVVAVRAAEDAAAVGRARVLLALGEVDGARGALAPLRGRAPAPPGLRALLAAVDLAAGDPAAAAAGARLALREDPADAHAASVLVDAAADLGDLDAAAAFLEGLAGGPGAGGPGAGGPGAGGPGAGGRLVAEVALARVDAARGEGSRARARLAALEADAVTPDALALLGGAWLAVGEPEAARAAWVRALDVDPSHPASLAGLGAAESARGRHARARAVLAEAWDRTRDPVVGAALAEAHLRAGAPGAAEALRASLRGVTPTPPRAEAPLPAIAALAPATPAAVAASPGAPSSAQASTGAAVATPSDTPPPDEGPVATGAALGAVASPEGVRADPCASPEARGGDRTEAAGLTARRAHVVLPRPTVDVGGTLLARTGGVGTNQMFAQLGTVGVDQAVGPLRVEVDALLVGLSDGARDLSGAAGAVGLAAPAGAPFVLRATIGTSPVGLSDTPYATWYGAAGWRLGRGEIGVDTGRAPITDSLASWGGVDTWGRAATTWGGAWAAWAGEDTDAGLRARVGALTTREMATGRRQLDLWAGHRLGTRLRSVRLGVQGTLLGHDDVPDGFGPGTSGAFTPPSYAAGSARVDGTWGFGRGAGLCGGLHVGAQEVGGADTAFYGEGTAAVAGIRAGGSLRLGRAWHAGVAARWDVVGEDWSEQAGLAWLRWAEGPDERFGEASPVFGAAVESLPVCR